MDAVIEVLEDVVEHFLVLGVDSEARQRRGAALGDGALLDDERFGDGRDDTQCPATSSRRPGHRVARPHHRRELDAVATNVPDRLRRQIT